jgi:hypothetical protein
MASTPPFDPAGFNGKTPSHRGRRDGGPLLPCLTARLVRRLFYPNPNSGADQGRNFDESDPTRSRVRRRTMGKIHRS